MPSWSITVEVARDTAEEMAAGFFEAGASGIEEREAGIAPMPGSPQPAAGKVLLVAWFPERVCAEQAAGTIPGAQLAKTADQDWGEVWKAGWKAFSVGRVMVRPSWIQSRPPSGAVEIVLDPGMAFGTGTHPTTTLCLQALDDAVAARPGLSVFDVGTGSGLLAIAAQKLGAGRVVASDNDPVAVCVARGNAQRNGVSIEVTGADVASVSGPFDLVVANILANTLIELAPALARQLAPRGTLLLSGLLAGQEEQVLAPYLAEGLAQQDLRRQGEWLLLAFSRLVGRRPVSRRHGRTITRRRGRS